MCASYHIRMGPVKYSWCEILSDIAEIESRSISCDLEVKTEYYRDQTVGPDLNRVGNNTRQLTHDTVNSKHQAFDKSHNN